MILVRVALALAFLAVLAPAAHVLEMPNKLALDGPLWLAVQQHLYRGWGPFYGAPVEIGALLASLLLLLRWRREAGVRVLAAIAALLYAGMIATFFAFNAPVNAALDRWTASSLPPDWTLYRLQWEAGHALAAILAVLAFLLLCRAFSLRTTRAG